MDRHGPMQGEVRETRTYACGACCAIIRLPLLRCVVLPRHSSASSAVIELPAGLHSVVLEMESIAEHVQQWRASIVVCKRACAVFIYVMVQQRMHFAFAMLPVVGSRPIMCTCIRWHPPPQTTNARIRTRTRSPSHTCRTMMHSVTTASGSTQRTCTVTAVGAVTLVDFSRRTCTTMAAIDGGRICSSRRTNMLMRAVTST